MKKWLGFLFVVLLVAAVATACARVESAPGKNVEPEQQDNKHEVTLWFSNNDASELVSEERVVTVPENKSLLQVIVEELPLPEGTEVLGVTTENGVITVDFNEKIHENFNGGSSYEALLILGVVNSVTEPEEYRDFKVGFLVNGEKFDSIGGHLSFSELFERNTDIFK
jgi:spore germination protein GerM